jgi:hypothetical protein
MGWKKRDFVTQAFDTIGIAGYVYDLEPEQLNFALRQLDSMMALWSSKGIKIGYQISDSADGSSLDDVTQVSAEANEAVYQNLSLRIAPGLGKQISPGLQIMAKQSYDALLIKAAMPGQMQFPGNMPIGAGMRGRQHYSTMPEIGLDILKD